MYEMLLGVPIIGEALITWTPLTFYIAAGILQAIVIIVGFKVLQVDPENNTFIGAAIAAIAITAAGFLTRDMGLAGILITGCTIFGLVMAVSGFDALKSIIVAGICFGVYAGLGAVVIPRTPLTPGTIGGLPKAVITGTIEEEPVRENFEDESPTVPE